MKLFLVLKPYFILKDGCVFLGFCAVQTLLYFPLAWFGDNLTFLFSSFCLSQPCYGLWAENMLYPLCSFNILLCVFKDVWLASFQVWDIFFVLKMFKTKWVSEHEFHETCHSVTFYFMRKVSKRCCDTAKARVNSHQRWKQMRFRICFHLWCELTSTINVTEWQVSWNSC